MASGQHWRTDCEVVFIRRCLQMRSRFSPYHLRSGYEITPVVYNFMDRDRVGVHTNNNNNNNKIKSEQVDKMRPSCPLGGQSEHRNRFILPTCAASNNAECQFCILEEGSCRSRALFCIWFIERASRQKKGISF